VVDLRHSDILSTTPVVEAHYEPCLGRFFVLAHPELPRLSVNVVAQVVTG
jgi:hypothetical protein